jgi:hypothetical protein
MRITIKLDRFDHADESAYAVLWLDNERGRWSREAHDGFELPAWGTWELAPIGTLLRSPDASAPIVMLDGLRLAAREYTPGIGQLATSAQGRAKFFRFDESGVLRSADAGHWHVQCIDREPTIAEHEIFSDEPDAPGTASAKGRDCGSFARPDATTVFPSWRGRLNEVGGKELSRQRAAPST